MGFSEIPPILVARLDEITKPVGGYGFIDFQAYVKYGMLTSVTLPPRTHDQLQIAEKAVRFLSNSLIVGRLSITT